MKLHVILTAIMLILATACGQQEDKQAKLDKLKAEKTELDSQIAELEKEIAAADTSKKEETVYQVSIQPVTPEKFEHTVEIQGVVYSENNITMTAENGGVVQKILVKEGEKVSKGQLLMDIDGSIVANNIAELNTRLSLAKETYNKQKRLYDQNIGTEMQYLQAKNNYEALKNQLATLETQLGKFRLRSPINGTVDAIFVRVGENTMPGMRAIRVVNLENVEVKADVSERYIGKFDKGDQVNVFFPALQDTVKAKISSVSQVINEANRTFEVRIELDNKNNKLKPNLLAIINAIDFSAADAAVIPANLVQTLGQDKFVMTAYQENGKWLAKRVSINTGLTQKGRIHVTSGLKGDEYIITAGYLNVDDGDILAPLNK